MSRISELTNVLPCFTGRALKAFCCCEGSTGSRPSKTLIVSLLYTAPLLTLEDPKKKINEQPFNQAQSLLQVNVRSV